MTAEKRKSVSDLDFNVGRSSAGIPGVFLQQGADERQCIFIARDQIGTLMDWLREARAVLRAEIEPRQPEKAYPRRREAAGK